MYSLLQQQLCLFCSHSIMSSTCHSLHLQLTHLFSLPQDPAYRLQPSRTRKPSRVGRTCLGHTLTHQPLGLRAALPYLARDDRPFRKRVLRELVQLGPWFSRQDKKLLEGRGWVLQFSGLPKTGLRPQWAIKAADCLTGDGLDDLGGYTQPPASATRPQRLLQPLRSSCSPQATPCCASRLLHVFLERHCLPSLHGKLL